jgi:fibronectin-binding autotransporter adhesin
MRVLNMSRMNLPCFLAMLVLGMSAAARLAQTADISGHYFETGADVPPQEANTLVGDTYWGWQLTYHSPWSYDVNINGYNFTLDDGGGNHASVSGALTGQGNVTYVGRGDLTWEGSDNWIDGTTANTYSGTALVKSGWLQLNKTAGVTAIPSDLQIGSGSSVAAVKLMQSDQIADTAVVSLQRSTGGSYGLLKMNGQNETIGGLQTLDAAGDAYVENNSGAASLSTLTVQTADGASYEFAGTLRDEPATAGKGSKLAFVKTGPGTQVLSGPITHTGGTTLNGGTLTINSLLPDANVTVASGTLNGFGTITFQDGNLISVGAGATFDASQGMKWDLTALGSSTPINLLDYTGGGTFTPPPSLGDLLTETSRSAWSLSSASGYVTASPLVAYAWNVDGNGNWSGTGNWITGVPNSVGGTANFSDKITADRAVTVDVPVTVGLIKFNNANKYTIAGADPNSITLDTSGSNAIIQLLAGDQEIAAPLVMNKSTDVTVTPPDKTLTISGAVGSGVPGTGINKNGLGTLLLSGSNSFDGPVHVNAGTLKLGGGNAIADSVDVTVALGAALDVNGSDETVGSLNSSGVIVLNDGALRATKASTVAGLTGTGTFYKTGEGDLTLNSNAAYSGALSVTGNSIHVAEGAFGDANGATTFDGVYWGAINTTVAGNENFVIAGGSTTFSNWGGNPTIAGSITIQSGATLVADTGGGNNGSYNGAIGGEGSFIFNGGPGGGGFEFSPTTLGGSEANTLSGPTAVIRGLLVLSKPAGADAIAGPLTIGAGADKAHVQLNADEQINDAVVVTIADKGDLRLNGHNETIGGLASTAGQGAVGNYGATDSVLTIGGPGDMEFGGQFLDGAAGKLSVVKSGGGELALSGASSHTGTTTVAGGKLVLIPGGSLGTGTAVIVAPSGDSAVFHLNGQSQQIASLTLGGATATSAASVTTGTGTLTLGGDVTYDATFNPAGATISSETGGGLDLGAATRTFAIGDSGETDAELTISAPISGTNAGIVKTGDGTLVLAGGNTYTDGTAVNGGTLRIASADALPSGTGLTIGGSGSGASAAAATAVPEPGTIGLLAAGAGMLLAWACRRR